MKKFERDELLGIFISIVVVAAFFAALRFEPWNMFRGDAALEAETDTVTFTSESSLPEVTRALADAMTAKGKIEKLIIQDSKEGEGKEVADGSVVKVNYIGMLQDGTEFDNSYKRGTPYEFVVGTGGVIKGWDVGILGMKPGGQRILVIPPAMGYGASGYGPIPPDATLLFSLELVSVE